MNIVEKYIQYIARNHAPGSGAAQSYVAAIKKLEILLHNTKLLPKTQSLWNIHNLNDLTRLYEFVKAEQNKNDGGIFRNDKAQGYWRRRFYSAAVKEYSQFISLYNRENTMFDIIAAASDGLQLSQELEAVSLAPNPLLIAEELDINSQEGKNVLREIEVRQNQYVFRKMILSIYCSRCCLTDLPIPETLRASHISGWAKDKNNRMNPENGLCLSATYDAAFDRHLISFDEQYRMILAPSLHEYCTNNAFQEQFKRFEGSMISMPKRFMPSQVLLAKHREQLH